MDGADREPGSEDPPIALVDLDGVVADVRHRLHHLESSPRDWEAFFAAAERDRPHPEGVAVVERLRSDHEVVYLTGRPARLLGATRAWLERHGLGGHRIVMRPHGDRRPAAVVKVELAREIAAGRRIAVVVDDDGAVLRAMRTAGFPTYAADWERRAADEEAALRRAQEAEGRT